MEEEKKTKKNTWGHMQTHKHIEKARTNNHVARSRGPPKNIEAGEMCTYTGEDGGIAKTERQKRKETCS